MRDLWRRGRAIWADFSQIGVVTYASSISYFTFLSLVPMLAICISLLSVVGISEQDIIDLLVMLVPDALDELVKMLVMDAFERSGIAFSLSTISLLWAASKGARAMRVGLNAAYKEQETRSAPVVAAISIVAGIIVDLLLAVAIYLVFSGSVSRAVAGFLPGFEERDVISIVLDSLATMALGTLSLAACYAFLPAGKRRFITQLPGAACAVLASGALSFGFRVYVDNFSNYTVLYGGLATVAMLLFWMYLISQILIAGGFLNRLLARKLARPSG